MSKQAVQRVSGVILLLVGIALLLGIFIEPFPVVGGKTMEWYYSEIAQSTDYFDAIPGLVAVELVKPSRTTVVTNIPISNPSAYNLELEKERVTPVLANSWVIFPYMVLSCVFVALGMITSVTPLEEK